MLDHGHAAELRERRLEVVQLESVWPIIFVRGAQHFEDLENLVNLRISHEQWLALHHLRKDATSGPKIDSKRVCLLSEENFWAPVPKCDDLVSVSLDRETKGASKTEISELDVLS